MFCFSVFKCSLFDSVGYKLFRWGRCYLVHGQFQGSSLFLPVDLVSLSRAFFAYAIWSLRLLKFILSRLSVFDFYTLLLYCVCNNCESFKSYYDVSNQ